MSKKETRLGAAYALGAFILWGINPLYFKAVDTIPVFEVLAHRVLWSVVFLAVLLTVARRWRPLRQALRDRKTLYMLLLSTLFISINWFFFIWAVAAERVLETSLGYYINPLVNVVLGMFFLRERLSRWQGIAVGLAAIGVLNLALQSGSVPWVSLLLAFTFGFYGLVRKTIKVESVDGLFAETAMVLPLALGYILYLSMNGQGSLGRVDLQTDLLLVMAGIVTAMPLIWFTSGARRLNYSTIGLFQYLAPTCQFGLAILVFGETFTWAHVVTFSCIWMALVIYSAQSWLLARRRLSSPA
ncbi:EamA family transporter RarD [Denitrobaculum tricleocarpae]|uniref:EamA family transporter RarD n=1 Tax=Denitrobaculum tricleocarpae TaxID=2591009 RepID=A0A545TWS6_9PROT|nr:EamA family transporter RarD [Denitrobaculum tricleocarpae]TQV81662.1 EamA family transporter RarD [Denitrobaculum tricleocarpae]